MERERLLPFPVHAQQQRAWDAARATTLVEILAPARFAPDVIALRFAEHGAPPEDMTWARLDRGARGRAAELTSARVGAGDRVVLMLPTGPAFFEAFFGTLLAGAVPVPVAPPPSARREKAAALFDTIVRIAHDCSAAAVVGLDRPLALLAEYLRERDIDLTLVSVSTPAMEPAAPGVATAAPRDLALLQYTSGSTSHPKGVELTHANIIANTSAIASAIVHGASAGVFWLPLHHDMGLIGGALTALYCRRPAVLMPPQAFARDPARWLQYLSDVRATITVAPNFAFSHCARTVTDEDVADLDLSALEVALNGAEPVEPAAIAAFEERFAKQGLKAGTVRPVYGLAESALAVTFGDPGPPLVDVVQADALEREGHARPPDGGGRTRSFVSVGRPLPTQEVRVVDAADRALADREVGEIVVRGPSITRGYYRQPEATTAALRGGWLHTGDLGYMAEGRLYITGRSKDLIIRLGRNYHAQDFERVVGAVPGVLPGGVVAFGVETADTTRIVVVAETRVREAEALVDLNARIRECCRQHFDIGPDDVRLATPGEIPRTTSGKVRRQACRQQYEAEMTASRP